MLRGVGEPFFHGAFAFGDHEYANGEYEQVERNVEDGGVEDRAVAENRGKYGNPDEADVSEGDHEAVRSPFVFREPQQKRCGERDRKDDGVACTRKQKYHSHGRCVGQLSAHEHRRDDEAGKRDIEEELRELTVETVVHDPGLSRDESEHHAQKEYDHLRFYRCEAHGSAFLSPCGGAGAFDVALRAVCRDVRKATVFHVKHLFVFGWEATVIVALCERAGEKSARADTKNTGNANRPLLDDNADAVKCGIVLVREKGGAGNEHCELAFECAFV